MPSFGAASRKTLDTCHQDLQDLCEQVIQNYDFSVLEGFRSNVRQDELFRQGKSKLRAGQSKHNNNPSLAVDIAPYPIDWDNRERFYLLAGMMFEAAAQMGIKLRWGGDWDRDWIHTDQKFHDLPHFELVREIDE
jgi:peptidoglycan L-alanyl-D-glutamate endopeptidase CwlK